MGNLFSGEQIEINTKYRITINYTLEHNDKCTDKDASKQLDKFTNSPQFKKIIGYACNIRKDYLDISRYLKFTIQKIKHNSSEIEITGHWKYGAETAKAEMHNVYESQILEHIRDGFWKSSNEGEIILDKKCNLQIFFDNSSTIAKLG